MRIRHVAFVVEDLEKSASFYEDVLNFKRLGPRTPGSYPGMALDLTDGEVHFSLLRPNDDIARQNWAHGTLGPNHIGVTLDDLEGVKQRLSNHGVDTFAERVNKDGSGKLTYFKFIDPSGAEVDVSSKNWDITY
jgi:catechol 2,3-dioxygenase-like lactoylglutathione lyase family enzyme